MAIINIQYMLYKGAKPSSDECLLILIYTQENHHHPLGLKQKKILGEKVDMTAVCKHSHVPQSHPLPVDVSGDY